METTNPINKNLRIGMVLAIALLLMSCGSSKSSNGSSDLSSYVPDPSTVGPKPLSYCSQATEVSTGMKAVLGTVYNSSNKPDPNYVHLKVINVPASFKDDNTYIALWKWYAESSGYSYVSNSPLAFKLVNIQSGADLTGNLTTLSWGNIASIASSLNASTPAQFFQKVRIFVYLNDPSLQYDAITVSIHSKSNGQSTNRIDALIPVFYADPRHYAVESSGAARASVLQVLHPFNSVDYSSWSATTFNVMANDICAPLNQY